MAWIGLLVSAIGAVSEGQSSKAESIEDAKVLIRKGVRDKAAYKVKESDYRDREKRLLGTGRVIGASQGTTSEGSPLLVSADYASDVEEYAMRIKQGGELAASRTAEQVALTVKRGRKAESAGAVRAGGSLLKGAGSYYGSS